MFSVISIASIRIITIITITITILIPNSIIMCIEATEPAVRERPARQCDAGKPGQASEPAANKAGLADMSVSMLAASKAGVALEKTNAASK